MYLEHFGLNELPFRITPHTDFFFEGADRGATLEALLYAILHDEGIVKVSGEVGSGKTMLCRVLIERLPKQVEIVYLANPSYSREEILYAIADELKLEFTRARATLALRELQEHLIRLYAQGRRVVTLIDEAHAMPEQTLEQVRLLSNLESNRHKLLQILLFGQPELDQALDTASLRQLKDRITHSFRMRPLTAAEAAIYVSFRMRAAGYRGPEVFTPSSIALIAHAASGLTRRINVLADKSLLAAFTAGSRSVTEQEARAAIADSDFAPLDKPRRPAPYLAAALAAGVAIGVGVHWVITALQEPPPAMTTPSPPAAPRAAAPLAPAAPAAEAPPAAATPAPAAPAAAPAAEAAKPAPQLAPEPPRSLLSPAQARRIAGYAARGAPLLEVRVQATLSRLEQEPDASYSIELFRTGNAEPARMERFLARARSLVPLADVYVIPVRIGERYYVRVTLGAFSDREAAAAAAERLPPKYKQAFRPELRSFAELRFAT